eukprot:765867-Hanusia_phi.AAC.3
MVRLDLDRLVQHQPSYLPAAVALPQQPPETGERVCIMRVDPVPPAEPQQAAEPTLTARLASTGSWRPPGPSRPGPARSSARHIPCRDLSAGQGGAEKVVPERHDVTRRQIKSSLTGSQRNSQS